jgi:hypothetical protein
MDDFFRAIDENAERTLMIAQARARGNTATGRRWMRASFRRVFVV